MTTPEAARLADEAKLRADSYMAAGSFRNGDSMMAKERAKLHAAIDALAALIPQECGQVGAEVARVPEGFWLAPLEPSEAILRPFYECPPEELKLAWAAAIAIAQATAQRAMATHLKEQQR
jgi:hypothetical protein